MATGYTDDDLIIPGLASGLLGFGAQAPNPIGLGADLSQIPAPTPPVNSGLIPLQIPTPQLVNPPSALADRATADAGSPGTADPMLMHQQRTIYGETAGLYPQLVTQPDKNGIYNPKNWDSGSADDLKTARMWMAGVRLRNGGVNESGPDLSNGVEKMAWGDATDAAQAAKGLQLPAGVIHFYIRQDGAGPQGPRKGSGWEPDARVYKSFGPFTNVGGGDVPKGPHTYIDFYKVGP